MSSAALTNTYWDLGWVRLLYGELGANTFLENKVDQLWTNICMWEFPATEEYNLLIRDRLDRYAQDSPDVMVKQIQNGKRFTIIIIENKRTSSAGKSAVWASAVRELTEYLDIELKSAIPKPKFQVGLVAIGRYVRFYRRTKSDSLQDYPGTGGKIYEVKNDMEKVQEILDGIKDETQKK